MKTTVVLAVWAGLALGAVPALAQDASATPSTEAGAAATTDGAMTEDTPVSVEIAIGGLSDDAKMSAAASAAETATEARVVYLSELQTGPTNATVEQLREMAAEKSDTLDKLRETLSANTDLSAMLEEQGGAEHIVSAALDQDEMLLIFVDDEHQM